MKKFLAGAALVAVFAGLVANHARNSDAENFAEMQSATRMMESKNGAEAQEHIRRGELLKNGGNVGGYAVQGRSL